MSRSPSATSSQSSQGPSPALAPPSVRNTARQREQESARSSRSSSLDDFIEQAARRSSRRATQQLPSPPHRTRPHTTAASTAPRAPTRTPALSLRQRMRSTIQIAEAEAVRAARDFSLEMYRELHQRHFKSVHEELDFLRKDFVASRRTLALLHEDNVRLEQELLARARQLEELQGQLEEAHREAEEAPFMSSSGQRPTAQSSSRRGSARRRRSSDGLDVSVLWAVPAEKEESPPPPPPASGKERVEGKNDEERSPSSGSRGGQESEGQDPVARNPTPSSEPPPRLESKSKPSPAVRTRHPTGTPLALYAPAVGKTKGGKLSAVVEGGDTDLRELIRDLRSNLARRDTALNAAQMELSAVQHSEQQKRTALRETEEALQSAKQQRDKLQANVTALEEQLAARSKEVEKGARQLEQLTKDKEDMQRRLTTAELLYEHTGARVGGGGVIDPQSGGLAGASSSSTATSGDPYLRDQLQLYRTKWQAAEDQVEHLNLRLSQLQRQLLHSRQDVAREASASTPATFVAPPAAVSDSSGGLREAVEQRRAEHAVELASLRRQHQEQLQLHAEETQRLQRRLDRAQENAAFHEDQLRQQRQDDARQHHDDLLALQTQLRTVQGELVKAQQDREHLARQLRRSTEQETTVEVLRGQINELKQRLGEVGAELAQVRGREKEISLQVQRERMARATAEHAVEGTKEELAQERREAEYLREEVKLLREQLGAQEASLHANKKGSTTPGVTTMRQDADSTPVTGSLPLLPQSREDGGDAAALASELKGYVSLMRVNATLQRRIAELEAQVSTSGNTQAPSSPAAAATIHASPFSVQHNTPRSAPPFVSDTVTGSAALDASRDVSVLRSQLDTALQKQRELLTSCVEAEKDRQLLAQDNVTLAKGVELLEKQLRNVKAALTAETEKRRQLQEAAQRRHRSQKRWKERQRAISARRHADAARMSPRRDVTKTQSTTASGEDSRLRQRLQTARAQDQIVVQEEVQRSPPMNTPPRESPDVHKKDDLLLGGQLASTSGSPYWVIIETVRQLGAAAASSSPVSATAPAPVPTATPVPATSQSEAPPATSTPSGKNTELEVKEPLAAATVAPVKERRDAACSPLHLPRRHVHGSVLPPVNYPPLVFKSRTLV